MAVTNKEQLDQLMAKYKQQGTAMQTRTQAQQAQAAQGAGQAQQAQPAGGAKANEPYSYQHGDRLSGVTDGTLTQMQTYQKGYNPSAAVIEAQNVLAQIQNNKPQGYNSKYAPQLDAILQQITNPEGFKWDFNGDELFQTYADMYNRKGQQAMMNAIGNATGLTGGYGNSYATQVGQQTYDEYMNDLFNVGMDLRDRAYKTYRDKQGDLLNQYGVLQGADQQDYDRYRDTVGDWETMLDYYTGRADTERNFDYGSWQDALNYWTNMAGSENADFWTGTNYNENQRQFNESLDWDKLSTEQKYAMQNVATMLKLGVAPSIETLLKAGFSQADAEAIMALFAPAPAAEGGGGAMGGGATPVDIAKEFGNFAGWQFGEGAKSLAKTMTDAANKVAAGVANTPVITPQTVPTKDYVNPDDKKNKKNGSGKGSSVSYMNK